MNGKMLGTAVGVALENREAIKNMSAPAMNASIGAGKVIFATFWKSIVFGLACIVVWFFAFVTTTVLTGSYFFVSPNFTAFFGLFLFLGLPILILVKETRKEKQVVQMKNMKQRAAAAEERQRREAEFAQQAQMQEQQNQQAMLFAQQQQQQFLAWQQAQQNNPATLPLPN